MSRHNAKNERIKHEFFIWLKEANGQSEASIDAAATAISRFEAYTKYRDFRSFHVNQAAGFKRHLTAQTSQKTGDKLSKATLNSTFAHLKRFFLWLAGQHGYKSKLKYSDADYFNFSEKGARIASAIRPKRVPTLEQLHHVLARMPSGSEVERRNRALFAFAMLTGARVSAIASIKLKHVDLDEGSVFQDAREVRTKFSKSFKTFFVQVGGDARSIFEEWVIYLRKEKLWGNDDPLFPTTKMSISPEHQFEVNGVEREHWTTSGPIREIFKLAFANAELPYFNPHSFRDTLAKFGLKVCRSPEDYKAWSQNLGHEGVMTTFSSYGNVAIDRQGEIIRTLTGDTAASPAELTAQERKMIVAFRQSAN